MNAKTVCSEFVVFLLGAIKLALSEALTETTTQETTQEKLLALITSHSKWTQKQFAQALEITPDGVKYHLTKLKQAGLIERVGSTKAGSSRVL